MSKHPRSVRTRLLACVGATGLGLAAGACDLGGAIAGSGAGELAKGAAGCPDLSSVKAVLAFDWAGGFGIDAATALKVRGGVAASLELKAFAAKLDAQLKTACGGLAKDLGSTAEFGSGEEACKAAIKAMGDIKGKIGGSAKISLSVQPPVCAASIDAYANCIADCDVDIEPGKVDVQCDGGKMVGECKGGCSGSCHMEAAAKCEGTCQGSCSADFKGTCGGDCNGKCDGKKHGGGHCDGECSGECKANAEGSCGGECGGTCQLAAEAECGGKCEGGCSGEFVAPSCTGDVKPPKASAECQASCDANVQAKVECIPPRVALNIEGGADAKAVAQYKAALEKNLPLILEVAIGMKDQAVGVATSAKAVVDGATTTIKSLKSNPTAGAKLTACVSAPFAAAISAAASIKASVNVSVDVKASASASASGSASGSAG